MKFKRAGIKFATVALVSAIAASVFTTRGFCQEADQGDCQAKAMILPTSIYCGKLKKVKRVNEATQFDIRVVLKNVSTGEFGEDGKIRFDPLVRPRIATLLIPTQTYTEQQQAAPLLVFSMLQSMQMLNNAFVVCISFPLSRKAFDSGFPYEFGSGTTLESAKSDLEKNRQF